MSHQSLGHAASSARQSNVIGQTEHVNNRDHANNHWLMDASAQGLGEVLTNHWALDSRNDAGLATRIGDNWTQALGLLGELDVRLTTDLAKVVESVNPYGWQRNPPYSFTHQGIRFILGVEGLLQPTALQKPMVLNRTLEDVSHAPATWFSAIHRWGEHTVSDERHLLDPIGHAIRAMHLPLRRLELMTEGDIQGSCIDPTFLINHPAGAPTPRDAVLFDPVSSVITAVQLRYAPASNRTDITTVLVQNPMFPYSFELPEEAGKAFETYRESILPPKSSKLPRRQKPSPQRVELLDAMRLQGDFYAPYLPNTRGWGVDFHNIPGARIISALSGVAMHSGLQDFLDGAVRGATMHAHDVLSAV